MQSSIVNDFHESQNHRRPCTMEVDNNQFTCPNAKCILFRKPSQGNIAYRSMTGKRKNIMRLRCNKCKKEFSERRGTLLERAHIDERKETVMLKCYRWGVPDKGIADIAEVDIKTVHLFQEKCAKRAEEHHNQEVRHLESEGIQMDEAYTKMQGKGAYWTAMAICMRSLMILGFSSGRRDQILADKLVAEVAARVKRVGLFLTDGWKPYVRGIYRFFGKKERKTKLRKMKRLEAEPIKCELRNRGLYAQVVKKRQNRRVVKVIQRSVFGKAKECLEYIREQSLGMKIHTIHIERLFGTIRLRLPTWRRRGRCCCKLRRRHDEKLKIFIDLYNWVWPHSSLKNLTPATAGGLIDKRLSYGDYIWLKVHPDHHENAYYERDKKRRSENGKVLKFPKLKDLYEVVQEEKAC